MVGALIFAAATTRAAAEPPETKTTPPLGAISLADPLGNMHSPTEWQVHRAVVLFFLGTECPVSNGYSPDMAALAAKYAKRGVACYGIYCEAEVTPGEVTAHAKGYGLTFPVLLDPEQALASAVGAGHARRGRAVARGEGPVSGADRQPLCARRQAARRSLETRTG